MKDFSISFTYESLGEKQVKYLVTRNAAVQKGVASYEEETRTNIGHEKSFTGK